MKCPVQCWSLEDGENLQWLTMVTSRPTKSCFRKSSSLAWTLCSMSTLTPCQYTHIPQANDSHSHYSAPPLPEAPMFILRKYVFEELVSTICHGRPRTSPINTSASHTHRTSCARMNERVTNKNKYLYYIIVQPFPSGTRLKLKPLNYILY